MNQMLNFPAIVTVPGPSPIEEAEHWRGRPSWRAAATRIWHIRAASFWFAALLADGIRSTLGHGRAARAALEGETALLVIALAALSLLCLLAWLTKRTTAYTITDTHVVMKYGIALPATLAIPFGAIEHVGIRVNKDHTGDIALRLNPGQKMLYPKLWPHVRPWSWLRAEPMLRCVPSAGVVGARLARGIDLHNDIRARLLQSRAHSGLERASEALQ